MKRMLVFVILAAFLLPTAASADQKKLRFVMVTKAVHPYYEPCYEGFKAAGAKYKVTVERVDPQKMELPLQVRSIEELIAQKVDAIIGGYWNVEAVEADLKGFPVTVFKLDDWGVPKYDELVFIASEKGVKNNKDVLRRFMKAVARGHQYAVEHPEEAVDAVAKANPEMERELIDRGVRLLAPLWKEMKPFGNST